jgi:hypothetical protein
LDKTVVEEGVFFFCVTNVALQVPTLVMVVIMCTMVSASTFASSSVDSTTRGLFESTYGGSDAANGFAQMSSTGAVTVGGISVTFASISGIPGNYQWCNSACNAAATGCANTPSDSTCAASSNTCTIAYTPLYGSTRNTESCVAACHYSDGVFAMDIAGTATGQPQPYDLAVYVT